MFIAFEGPDNTGKSTSANRLDVRGEATYNATKENHAAIDRASTASSIICYDRIDWFTHMVYRLSLPDRDWNDARPRTVFAMPDTHLVIKIHRPDLAELISDELYSTGTLAKVNPLYFYFANFFTGLNVQQEFALFKTVSLIEVSNDPRDQSFSQKLIWFSSPVIGQDEADFMEIYDDTSLLHLLQIDDERRV